MYIITIDDFEENNDQFPSLMDRPSIIRVSQFTPVQNDVPTNDDNTIAFSAAHTLIPSCENHNAVGLFDTVQ